MTTIARCLTLLLICSLFAAPALANVVTTPRTETSLISDVKAVHAGQQFWAVLHIKLQPGWHTYWKNAGDSGIPPALEWTLPNGFHAGEVHYLAPDREVIGPLVDYAYNNDAYYLIPITPPSVLNVSATSILMLKADVLVCNDVCIPETSSLSLALPTTDAVQPQLSGDGELVAGLIAKLPISVPQPLAFYTENHEVHFDFKAVPGTANSAQFYPLTDGLIANAAEQKTQLSPGKITFAIRQAEGTLPEKAEGVVSLYSAAHERKDFAVTLVRGKAPVVAGFIRIRTALLFALLGGLILNLMPCVFPILSLKALAVAKKSATHARVIRLQGIAYAAGTVVSFLALAFALIALRQSGEAVGWGFQMQSPVSVAGLTTLLFLVGLNLSGYFELPSWFGNLGAGAASKDNLFGSFATGVLAVLVATPCTAPFMAPAIGFALTQHPLIIALVFAALGIGLAAPFLLISLYPRLVSFLPKPGAWMLTFRQFLAFPMYASVVWLLWVLAREGGADAAGITLMGLLSLAFALWLASHGSMMLKSAGLVIAVIGCAAAVMVLHPSVSILARGGAEPFTTARLDTLRAQGKAVFVDATADWCITCKVNETVALSTQGVMHRFEQKHITYMVADWTHNDEDITRYLESFGRNGVPIYVYYPPHGDPVVLPQILTPSIVLGAIEP